MQIIASQLCMNIRKIVLKFIVDSLFIAFSSAKCFFSFSSRKHCEEILENHSKWTDNL